MANDSVTPCDEWLNMKRKAEWNKPDRLKAYKDGYDKIKWKKDKATGEEQCKKNGEKYQKDTK